MIIELIYHYDSIYMKVQNGEIQKVDQWLPRGWGKVRGSDGQWVGGFWRDHKCVLKLDCGDGHTML